MRTEEVAQVDWYVLVDGDEHTQEEHTTREELAAMFEHEDEVAL